MFGCEVITVDCVIEMPGRKRHHFDQDVFDNARRRGSTPAQTEQCLSEKIIHYVEQEGRFGRVSSEFLTCSLILEGGISKAVTVRNLLNQLHHLEPAQIDAILTATDLAEYGSLVTKYAKLWRGRCCEPKGLCSTDILIAPFSHCTECECMLTVKKASSVNLYSTGCGSYPVWKVNLYCQRCKRSFGVNSSKFKVDGEPMMQYYDDANDFLTVVEVNKNNYATKTFCSLYSNLLLVLI